MKSLSKLQVVAIQAIRILKDEQAKREQQEEARLAEIERIACVAISLLKRS